MSDVKRLLAEATPLPWQHSGPGPLPDGDQMWLTGDGHRHQMIAWTDASGSAAVDLKLAALAVNRLPDYEAAVDALEVIAARMLEWERATREAGVYRDGDPDQQMARWVADKAHAALARLREPVSA